MVLELLRGVVHQRGLMKMLHRLLEPSHEPERDRQVRVRGHESHLALVLAGDGERLLCYLERLPDLAADEIVCVKSPQCRRQHRRGALRLGENASPVHRSHRISRSVSTGDRGCRAEHQLKSELESHQLRRALESSKECDGTTRETACLIERKYSERCFGSDREVACGPNEFPRGLEEKSQLGSSSTRYSSIEGEQCLANSLAESYAARYGKR